MKKIITVDFDGVIIEKVLGIDWNKQKKSRRKYTGIGFGVYRVIDKYWTRLNYWWRKPVEGSLEGIKRLKAKNYKVVLLTSRFGYHRKTTEIWLKKLGFSEYFDGLFFNDKNIGAIDSKIENIKIIGAGIHIDDNRETVMELRKTYPNLRVLWLGKKGEIKSWDEIEL